MVQMQDPEFGRTPLSALRPYKNNPRVHPKSQLDELAASFGQFGFYNPILIDEHGEIIAGHGRYLAAQQAGLSEVLTIRLQGLSDAQRRALRIADNKIAQHSAWDIDVLRIELEAIAELDVDFDRTFIGFSTGELDVVLGAKPATPEEPIPAAPPNPITRRGDIWRLGGHVLGCGDARDLDFLRRIVGDRSADVAFLDPPYNVAIQGHAGGKGKIKHAEFAMASGEMSQSEFIAYLEACLGACAQVSREGAVHFVCMDHRHIDELSSAAATIYGERLNIAVWNKSNAGMGSLYRSKHEFVFVYRVGEAPHFNAVELGKHGRNRTNVWDYASVNSFKGARRHDLALHPTVKPVQLVADALMDVSRRGDIALDVFMGSGTTLIAAERSGRFCRGLEIEPAYVDVALERWRAMTGEEPFLLAPVPLVLSEVRARRAEPTEID